jgi:hypothetical protein
VLTLAVVALLAVLGSATPARAQLTNFYGPNLTDTNAQSSANAGLFDIGSNFLLRLNKEATWGTSAAQNANPNGGGAPAPTAPGRKAMACGRAPRRRTILPATPAAPMAALPALA